MPGEGSAYWSLTNLANGNAIKWMVGYFFGNVSTQPDASTQFVRCVRGNFAGYGIYKDNGDGTVTDLATGLIWQRQDDNDLRRWDNAIAYCEGLNLGGKQDWRLPNIKELQSIVDYRLTNPAIDSDAFPGTNYVSPNNSYWSATTFALDSAYAGTVRFDNGNSSPGEILKSETRVFTRCVRGGQ